MEVRLGHKPRLTWLIYSSIGTQQCSAVGVENACGLGNALFSSGNNPMVIPWGVQARSHVGDVPLLLNKQWCTVVDEESGSDWVALQPFLSTPTNCTHLVSSSTSFDFNCVFVSFFPPRASWGNEDWILFLYISRPFAQWRAHGRLLIHLNQWTLFGELCLQPNILIGIQEAKFVFESFLSNAGQWVFRNAQTGKKIQIHRGLHGIESKLQLSK